MNGAIADRMTRILTVASDSVEAGTSPDVAIASVVSSLVREMVVLEQEVTTLREQLANLTEEVR